MAIDVHFSKTVSQKFIPIYKVFGNILSVKVYSLACIFFLLKMNTHSQ